MDTVAAEAKVLMKVVLDVAAVEAEAEAEASAMTGTVALGRRKTYHE
jgi:hypothetical protein